MWQKVLDYTIKLESEAHPGTGLGIPGLVDALVARDGDGRLYIDEGTIKGMVRDAAERFLNDLGFERNDGRVQALFGQKGTQEEDQGVLSFFPAEPKTVSEMIDVPVRYGNKTDPEAGAVQEDFFFSREALPAETEFLGEVYGRRKIDDKELHLLILALKRIETIGGKRTRGTGWVRFVLNGGLEPDKDKVKQWLEEIKNQEEPAQNKGETR